MFKSQAEKLQEMSDRELREEQTKRLIKIDGNLNFISNVLVVVILLFLVGLAFMFIGIV